MVRLTPAVVLGLALLAGLVLLATRLIVGTIAFLVKFGGVVLVGFLIAYALYELRCRLRRA